jgi:hydrophobic/amphiphilic exporter-1 (mainly G- bacteria), HAE1 family
VLIVFLFLNSWRSTVITGLTLPIALIGTFLFMYVLGFTINTITMMALSLCVGLLIDDAIVVRENIVRHIHMGKSARQAALDGTSEIGLAVLATTLSIVAVFLPIGFMGGIVGKFFHEFGLTIVAAVLISMFVSFTLDPMLSSVWHDPPTPSAWYRNTLGRVTSAFDHFTTWLSGRYQAILAWSLKHKLATLAIALATFVGSFGLIPLLGAEFVPKADLSETTINFYTPVGSSIEVTEQRAQQIDQLLRQLPEVKYTVTTINSGFAAGKIYGAIYVRLVDRKERQRSVVQMTTPLRQQLAAIPGITITNIGQTDLGGGKSLQFSIQGPDLAQLEKLSVGIMAQLQKLPGLADLDSSLKPNKPTVTVTPKRDAAADVGLNVNSLSNSLRTWLAGTSAGTWRAPDGESYDVLLRLPPQLRDSVADLRNLPIPVAAAADGSSRVVRLSQVAAVEASSGLSQINRRDLNREINIDANALGRSAGEVSADIKKILDSTPFPPGYRYSFGGSTKNMNESFSYAIGALGLAVIFIYMILASQFHSFLQPLALMSSLPLTLIGVVLTLLMFGSTLNMFSIIGIVMLMGLVTKNAILLIDFAIRSRQGEHGLGVDVPPMDREAALLHAAQVRLRPILMTTLAMVFGMVPLAFALSEGSEQRAPMGQAVIGGVITSSLLTLVVVPVIYCYLDDLVQWSKRRWGRTLFKRQTPPPKIVSLFAHRLSEEKMNIEQARFNMIEQQIRPWDVLDTAVLELLAVVRREDFVPPALKALAFADIEIPLPAGQCMLMPRLEARLLQDLAAQPHETVLEIGTGSGFMAALLAHRAQRVVSLEIEPELVQMAQNNLRNAGIHNVEVRHQDGAALNATQGGFDAIVLSGSVAQVPTNLLSMLKVGGRLVAVVGDDPIMRATVVTRTSDTAYSTVQTWDIVIPRLQNFPEPSRFTL